VNLVGALRGSTFKIDSSLQKCRGKQKKLR